MVVLHRALHQPTSRSCTTRERLTSVRVRLELGNRRLGLLDRAELDDSGALGTTALEEDFGLLDLARRLEELDQVLVAGRPRKLRAKDVSTVFEEQRRREGRTFLTKI